MGNKGGLGRRRDRLWVGLRSTPTQSFATHFHTPNTALLAPFSHILSSRHISAGSSLITHVNMYQRRTERTTSSSKKRHHDIYKIGDMRSTCRVQNHRDGSGRNDQGVSIGKFRSSFVAPYYMDVRYIHTHYNRIYHRRRRTGDQRLLQEVFSAAKVPRLMPPGRTSEHKRPPSPRT